MNRLLLDDLLHWIRLDGLMSPADYAVLLEVRTTAVIKLLRKAQKKGLIKSVGKDKRWIILSVKEVYRPAR